MTMWRCCSECSIPRAGASEQLGLQEEKEVEVGETRPDYIHTHQNMDSHQFVFAQLFLFRHCSGFPSFSF